jgi:hypothetical protein
MTKNSIVKIIYFGTFPFSQAIYKRGGRKFGFINLPPLGCLPGMRIIKPEKNGSCLEEVSSLAKLHNIALSMLLPKLEKHLKGFRYSFFNFNINLRQRMNHPSKYGMYVHVHPLPPLSHALCIRCNIHCQFSFSFLLLLVRCKSMGSSPKT